MNKSECPTEQITTTIEIIGAGGFGGRVVSRIGPEYASNDQVNVALHAIDTDGASLSDFKPYEVSALHLPYLVHGTCEGLPSLGRIVGRHYRNLLFGNSIDSEQSSGLLNFRVKNIFVVVVGIGGGSGTGLAQVISKKARKHGALAISVACMPLDGAILKSNPWEELERLKKSSGVVFVIDPNLAGFGVGLLASGFDRMAWAEQQTYDCVSAFIKTITTNGLIGFDLDDIRELFNNSWKSYYGFGVTSGINSPEESIVSSVNLALAQHHDSDFHSKHENINGGLIAFSFPPSKLGISEIRAGVDEIRLKLGPDKNYVFSATATETLSGVRTDIWLSGGTRPVKKSKHREPVLHIV